jgi:hypothetical protein
MSFPLDFRTVVAALLFTPWTDTGKHHVVFVNLNSVFVLDFVIDTVEIIYIHIKNTSAIFALEMIMLIRALIIPLHPVRQRNLTNDPIGGKLT